MSETPAGTGATDRNGTATSMPAKRKSSRKSQPAVLYKAHRIALDLTDKQATLCRGTAGLHA